jgi:predicted transcriptional regulator
MELEDQEGKNVFLSIDNLFEILGNPTRRIILSRLAKVPLGASELAASFGKKISRQAIHSQLKMLTDYGIIESFGEDPRSIKYRINSNLSLRIDITPDYYKMSFNVSKTDKFRNDLEIKDTGCQIDYQEIRSPAKKLRFLGEKIKEIEQNIGILEKERIALLHNKECFIIELKNIIQNQYEEDLKTKEQPNLEKEIFYTLFYNPIKYNRRINIDKLLDDIFFSEMGPIRRDMTKLTIRHLLRDLTGMMDFLREDEDDFWFFDF